MAHLTTLRGAGTTMGVGVAVGAAEGDGDGESPAPAMSIAVVSVSTTSAATPPKTRAEHSALVSLTSVSVVSRKVTTRRCAEGNGRRDGMWFAQAGAAEGGAATGVPSLRSVRSSCCEAGRNGARGLNSASSIDGKTILLSAVVR